MSQLQVNRINDASGGVLAPISSVMRNRIINGAMVIDQYKAGAAFGTSVNGYAMDRWAIYQSVTGKLNGGQNYNSVTPPVGFTNYLGVQSQSAYSISSTDYYIIQQSIEGFNTADLGWGTANAKTVTLSFWVQSSLTGTFGGVFQNATPNRSYPFTYTISSANTWEYKTITVAGDTSGTWNTTNVVGIQIRFGLGIGSTFSGTAGSWSGNNYFSATGATSVVGTNGATFYITGVQLEVGTQATSFEYRQYGTELALCQRYYYQHARGANQNIGVGCYYNSSTFVGFVQFPVTMRTAPSLVSSNTSGDFVFYRNDAGDTFDTFTGINEPSTTSANIRNTTQASGTAGQAGLTITANSTSLLAFNSEL